MGRQASTFKFQEAGVLIVDENTGFMDLTAQILMAFGFRKLERRGLKDAEGRNGFDPDLIIVDPFPDLDAGFRLIEDHRRRQTPGSPPAVVIVVTGHTPRPLIEKARRVGADYIVAKPFSANTLLDRILWSTSSVFANVASGEVEDEDTDNVAYHASIQNATAALLQ
ncbi:MAG: hypothetical protein B7Z12_11860 [Caulobacter vibrioides]|uniref:Response regulatory domain-containing protein n=1 Tax=Caulobacter vibrioides TaxID=155892 RepID=A0A258D5G0_CAUVI|nr:MAG: hypothetical protein B7Z12_11860 [Caulobacter vibrioides]